MSLLGASYTAVASSFESGRGAVTPEAQTHSDDKPSGTKATARGLLPAMVQLSSPHRGCGRTAPVGASRGGRESSCRRTPLNARDGSAHLERNQAGLCAGRPRPPDSQLNCNIQQREHTDAETRTRNIARCD